MAHEGEKAQEVAGSAGHDAGDERQERPVVEGDAEGHAGPEASTTGSASTGSAAEGDAPQAPVDVAASQSAPVPEPAPVTDAEAGELEALLSRARVLSQQHDNIRAIAEDLDRDFTEEGATHLVEAVDGVPASTVTAALQIPNLAPATLAGEMIALTADRAAFDRAKGVVKQYIDAAEPVVERVHTRQQQHLEHLFNEVTNDLGPRVHDLQTRAYNLERNYHVAEEAGIEATAQQRTAMTLSRELGLESNVLGGFSEHAATLAGDHAAYEATVSTLNNFSRDFTACHDRVEGLEADYARDVSTLADEFRDDAAVAARRRPQFSRMNAVVGGVEAVPSAAAEASEAPVPGVTGRLTRFDEKLGRTVDNLAEMPGPHASELSGEFAQLRDEAAALQGSATALQAHADDFNLRFNPTKRREHEAKLEACAEFLAAEENQAAILRGEEAAQQKHAEAKAALKATRELEAAWAAFEADHGAAADALDEKIKALEAKAKALQQRFSEAEGEFRSELEASRAHHKDLLDPTARVQVEKDVRELESQIATLRVKIEAEKASGNAGIRQELREEQHAELEAKETALTSAQTRLVSDTAAFDALVDSVTAAPAVTDVSAERDAFDEAKAAAAAPLDLPETGVDGLAPEAALDAMRYQRAEVEQLNERRQSLEGQLERMAASGPAASAEDVAARASVKRDLDQVSERLEALNAVGPGMAAGERTARVAEIRERLNRPGRDELESRIARLESDIEAFKARRAEAGVGARGQYEKQLAEARAELRGISGDSWRQERESLEAELVTHRLVESGTFESFNRVSAEAYRRDQALSGAAMDLEAAPSHRERVAGSAESRELAQERERLLQKIEAADALRAPDTAAKAAVTALRQQQSEAVAAFATEKAKGSDADPAALERLERQLSDLKGQIKAKSRALAPASRLEFRIADLEGQQRQLVAERATEMAQPGGGDSDKLARLQKQSQALEKRLSDVRVQLARVQEPGALDSRIERLRQQLADVIRREAQASGLMHEVHQGEAHNALFARASGDFKAQYEARNEARRKLDLAVLENSSDVDVLRERLQALQSKLDTMARELRDTIPYEASGAGATAEAKALAHELSALDNLQAADAATTAAADARAVVTSAMDMMADADVAAAKEAIVERDPAFQAARATWSEARTGLSAAMDARDPAAVNRLGGELGVARLQLVEANEALAAAEASGGAVDPALAARARAASNKVEALVGELNTARETGSSDDVARLGGELEVAASALNAAHTAAEGRQADAIAAEVTLESAAGDFVQTRQDAAEIERRAGEMATDLESKQERLALKQIDLDMIKCFDALQTQFEYGDAYLEDGGTEAFREIEACAELMRNGDVGRTDAERQAFIKRVNDGVQDIVSERQAEEARSRADKTLFDSEDGKKTTIEFSVRTKADGSHCVEMRHSRRFKPKQIRRLAKEALEGLELPNDEKFIIVEPSVNGEINIKIQGPGGGEPRKCNADEFDTAMSAISSKMKTGLVVDRRLSGHKSKYKSGDSVDVEVKGEFSVSRTRRATATVSNLGDGAAAGAPDFRRAASAADALRNRTPSSCAREAGPAMSGTGPALGV